MNFKFFIILSIFSIYVMGMTEQKNDEKVESFTITPDDFEVIKKKYDFLFRRVPEDIQNILYIILHNPEEFTRGDNLKHIQRLKDYLNNGGTSEEIEKDTTIYLGKQKIDTKKLRNSLFALLISILENQEDFESIYSEQYNYFMPILASNKKRVMFGKRRDGKLDIPKITIDSLSTIEKKYKSCLKEKSDCSAIKLELKNFKKGLVGHYKIHLMPRDDDILPVLQILMRAIKKDKKLGKLISKFKVKTDLALQYQRGDTNAPYALIVVYPTEGQDKAQALVEQLEALFKDTNIQGIGQAPRYNLKLNDLIFYAQGDADLKKPDKETGKESPYLKYFDKETNYALYKKDFEGSEHDYRLKI